MILDTHRKRVLREQRWDGIAGNDKAIRTVRKLTERAAETGDPLVLILSGPSGVGKSLTAALACREYGTHQTEVTELASGACRIDSLRDIADDWRYSSLFGSKALVIEEVDTASPDALAYLLTFCERLAERRVIVMTTNVKRDDFKALSLHAGSLIRRAHWVAYTTQGLATSSGKAGPGALLVKRVLASEGLDGQPDSYYVKLVNDCKGNLGEAILEGERRAIADE